MQKIVVCIDKKTASEDKNVCEPEPAEAHGTLSLSLVLIFFDHIFISIRDCEKKFENPFENKTREGTNRLGRKNTCARAKNKRAKRKNRSKSAQAEINLRFTLQAWHNTHPLCV